MHESVVRLRDNRADCEHLSKVTAVYSGAHVNKRFS